MLPNLKWENKWRKHATTHGGLLTACSPKGTGVSKGWRWTRTSTDGWARLLRGHRVVWVVNTRSCGTCTYSSAKREQGLPGEWCFIISFCSSQKFCLHPRDNSNSRSYTAFLALYKSRELEGITPHDTIGAVPPNNPRQDSLQRHPGDESGSKFPRHAEHITSGRPNTFDSRKSAFYKAGIWKPMDIPEKKRWINRIYDDRSHQLETVWMRAPLTNKWQIFAPLTCRAAGGACRSCPPVNRKDTSGTLPGRTPGGGNNERFTNAQKRADVWSELLLRNNGVRRRGWREGGREGGREEGRKEGRK